MFKVLIVDDDFSVIDAFKKSIKFYSNKIKIIKVNSISKTKDYLGEDIDFFILSIKKEFDEIKMFTNEINKFKKYQNTFITTVSCNTEHIINAYYEKHCIDHIVKPFTEKSFYKTVSFIGALLDGRLDNRNKLSFLNIEQSDTFAKIPIEDILFIESYGRKCIIHTYFEDITICKTLKKLISESEGTSLIRCHKSFIVNTKNIRLIDKREESWKIKFFNSPLCCYAGKCYKKSLCNEYDK